jgi:hypothetical protein
VTGQLFLFYALWATARSTREVEPVTSGQQEAA